MSGIFGIFHTGGNPVATEPLQAMAAGLKRRGPNGSGIWQEGQIALGHCLLASYPDARSEILPLHDEGLSLSITADVRLTNRDELIDSLEMRGALGGEITDHRLILEAYARWQEACVEKLFGDFSFAIWDSQRRVLFCARDHLGVKPLCYYWQFGTFVFCSEAWVIAAHAGVRASLNEARIGDYLTPHLEGYDKISTFYREISRLPPAHTLCISTESFNHRHYWQPEPEDIWEASDADYQDAFAEVLNTVVRDSCRGTDTPALLLSGGVDSAGIAALASRIVGAQGSSIECYSGISRAPSCKETAMIETMSTTVPLALKTVTVEEQTDAADEAFQLLKQIREPFDVFMSLHLILFRMAARHGHTFILDGVDGDTSMSLSASYPAFLLGKGSIWSGLREIYHQSRDVYPESTFLRLLTSYVQSGLMLTPLKHLVRPFRLKSSIRRELAESPIAPDFAQKIDFEKRLRDFTTRYESGWSRDHRHKYLAGVHHPFVAVGLERYDRIGSLCSIEPRHPLLDKRIIDFFRKLPWYQFVRYGWPKYLYRKSVESYLPAELCWRTGKEHVGNLFTQRVFKNNFQELFSIISSNYDFVTKYMDPSFAFSREQNYNEVSNTFNFNNISQVAGLVLWHQWYRSTNK